MKNMETMPTGKRLRMRRFTRRGGAVIIPLDHALYAEPAPALADLRALVKLIADTEADGILVTPGMLEHVAPVVGDLGIVLRVDGTHTRLGQHLERTDMIATAEGAAALGAEMVVVNAFVGVDNEDFHLNKLGMLATECRRLGLLLMGEMIPSTILNFHFAKEKKSATPQAVNRDVWLAARLGAEIGADVIKTQYTGDPEGFRQLTAGTPVPVWIAGGPVESKDDAAFMGMIAEAVAAGAQGAVIGRNVWQRESPRKAIAELCRIVHGKARP
jgi:DhnA family fructose-bisphosphate aldolase class Ia